MNFKKLNDLVGWGVFLIATFVYFSTLEPTASWWDCGEYISTAYKLQVGHPPGAPLFQMLGRFFSLFAFGDTSRVALMINAMSALSSSFTILFLFWTITMLARKFMLKGENENNQVQQIAVLGAGAVGALAYTFSDSFWFSAVEGEVYAMSSFFTAVTFWAILKWERVADEPHNYRWLLFIAYLVGLSIGVHMLNLLAIPAIVYVYYFKKYNPTLKGFVIAGLVSLFILGFVMSLIIPWIVKLAGLFELLFVNSFGMPFNTGSLIYFAMLGAAIIYGLKYTFDKGKVVLNTILLSFMFILIGYSSFFLLVIRAGANTPINENNPDDAISMLAYLNREQYGDWPLVTGQYYMAPRTGAEDGNPVYVKDIKKGKYVITDNRKGTEPVYDERFITLFPRMWSNQKPGHIRMYKEYGGDNGIPIRVTKEDGSSEVLYRPTYGENLKFFFSYQISHMYLRYFMWNFVGRQNDIESQGEIENGNWISGFGFLDSMRLGDQDHLPKSMQNPARAVFYFLPLILGLLGVFYLFKRDQFDTWVVFLLFILTGVAITIYLNQTPYQPRERDYAYAGSFYAFAIWIGIGVLSLYEFASKYLGKKVSTITIVIAISLVLVPGIMATQGWEAHNRSGKYAARDFAKAYLAQCEPNAILFTNGDNDTFPLWYVQEVEGFRTDVRVVNYMLASGDWYVHQLGKKVYESDRLKFTLKPDQYNKGINEYIPVLERISGPVELKDVINFVAEDNDRNKVPLQSGEKINYFPTRKLVLSIDKNAVIRNKAVPDRFKDSIVNEIKWEVKQNAIFKNDLMLLDFIANNNWERPIYFANPASSSKVFDIDTYCHMEGLVYRFMPYKAASYYKNMGGVYTDGSYEMLINKAKWGNLEKKDVTVDRESYRNTAMAKQAYLRLAQGLMNEGKKELAVNALDKSIEFFPNSKITFDYFMLPYIEIYFAAGATDKAVDLLRTLTDRYTDDLGYYSSLDGKFKTYYNQSTEEALAVLQRLSSIAEQNKQTDLSKEIDDQFQKFIGLMGYSGN
jgi:tetratricopeptide (TPR) repeat protein